MHIDVWGLRTGKTTSRAIPAILAAPGAVLVTSNKRDIVDATRDVRAAGGPVWVFDPQAVALEEPSHSPTQRHHIRLIGTFCVRLTRANPEV